MCKNSNDSSLFFSSKLGFDINYLDDGYDEDESEDAEDEDTVNRELELFFKHMNIHRKSKQNTLLYSGELKGSGDSDVKVLTNFSDRGSTLDVKKKSLHTIGSVIKDIESVIKDSIKVVAIADDKPNTLPNPNNFDKTASNKKLSSADEKLPSIHSNRKASSGFINKLVGDDTFTVPLYDNTRMSLQYKATNPMPKDDEVDECGIGSNQKVLDNHFQEEDNVDFSLVPNRSG